MVSEKLTTSQLILNLEKIIDPAMIAVTANLTSNQLAFVDKWANGEKELNKEQYTRLSFAWETLVKMTNINGAKPAAHWYRTPSIRVTEKGKKIICTPAGAIIRGKYKAVQKAIGPL